MHKTSIGYLMKAPKCRICGTQEFNHFCGGSVGLSNLSEQEPEIELYLPKLEARVETLEGLVDELLVFKRKRSDYMREYMKKRRKKGTMPT